MRQSIFHSSKVYLIISLFLTSFMIGACIKQQKYAGKDASNDVGVERWKVITEPTLGFKAQFPGQWKYNVEFMETDKGMATVHIFEYWHVAFMYGMTIVKFPPGVSDMSNPEKVLDYSIKTLIDEHNGKLVDQYNINMSGYPARRAIIELPDSYLKNARVNTLVILRNNLVYRISTSGIGNEPYIDHYMKSFELIPVSY